MAGQTHLARELRKRQTNAEEVLWEQLRDRRLSRFKFRRQHQFGYYIADYFCREANLVIECDGDIHHQREAWHHDQERDAYMIGQGVRVIRFSNDRILNDIEGVLSEIQRHLPSPAGRGVGGEGLREPATKPSPQPSSRGRGRGRS